MGGGGRAGGGPGGSALSPASASPWPAPGGSGRLEIRSGRNGEVLAAVLGTRPTEGLGWHMERAAASGPARVPGLIVSALWWESRPGWMNVGLVRVFEYLAPAPAR